MLECKKIIPELIKTRRLIHMYPELGFQEFKTSKLVEARLQSYGIKTSRIAKTGIFGLLEGKSKGKTILLRADMDALPLNEQNNLSYKSRHHGVMHACGHDAHTAMLLYAAGILSKMRGSFSGLIKFMFQPAEEGPGGAIPMIKAGILQKPQVDAAFALHVWNDLKVGQIGIRSGPVFAAAQSFIIEIIGRGAHGAKPHQAIDPVVIASNFITIMQNIVSRKINPVKPAVVTVGKIEAGTRFNIIPDRAVLHGTIRALEPRIMQQLKNEIKAILRGLSISTGSGFTLRFENYYPPTVNDPVLSNFVRGCAKEVVGARNVVEQDSSMGAEDMSFVLGKVPGCYVVIGSSNKAKGITSPNHSARFNIDEDALPIGVELLVKVALDYLRH